jgi:hypothetical protein
LREVAGVFLVTGLSDFPKEVVFSEQFFIQRNTNPQLRVPLFEY